jgi:hypothetical protein
VAFRLAAVLSARATATLPVALPSNVHWFARTRSVFVDYG